MNESNEQIIIFDLTRTDWKYKGVLFAEIDENVMFSGIGAPPVNSDWYAGIMALIYVDEQGEWIYKQRVKFPSGNKQVGTKHFGKDSNENKIIEYMCSIFPMKNQIWKKNIKEDGWGIVEIIEDFDMIEDMRIEKE